jgi:HTH-type transcriptional regulator/antitoxin MqsA
MVTVDKTRPCPSCDGLMRRGAREETVTYLGESLSYQQPGWHCDGCDDGILEGDDNAVSDAALHEVMARAKHSPISPLMVRAARDAVGVSQREAGRVFGGGPTAFYKYETARAVPSVGMANLLRLAIQQPALFRARPRETFKRPSGAEKALLRKTLRDDRLGEILEQVYPGEDHR